MGTGQCSAVTTKGPPLTSNKKSKRKPKDNRFTPLACCAVGFAVGARFATQLPSRSGAAAAESGIAPQAFVEGSGKASQRREGRRGLGAGPAACGHGGQVRVPTSTRFSQQRPVTNAEPKYSDRSS